MQIPPKYFLTPKISQLLQTIEANKEVINSIFTPLEIEINIRRKSILKSSLFSARIEGNNTTEDTLSQLSSKDQKRREIFNILKALEWIIQRSARDFNTKDLLTLHQMVMGNLIEKSDLGRFRVEVSAIFNSAGIAIYMPPSPGKISSLITKLLKFVNSSKEQFTPIKACLTHYTFEKIHPFLDGNGRIGRLFLQAVLNKGDYGMKGLAVIEEYLDNHRSAYYQTLESSENDVTDFLQFMLEAISSASEKAKQQILEKQKVSMEDLLLPRRAEILNIIKDHALINFDTIKRRFMSINERTLRYDLKKLADQGLIRKRGTTKGVYYEPIKNSTTSPSLIS
ncbi:Fic family protein [Candidatus Daviesbacteria bacterium]|nr:Fic family protein [Candidatus Daviesbacteria bacterium]